MNTEELIQQLLPLIQEKLDARNQPEPESILDGPPSIGRKSRLSKSDSYEPMEIDNRNRRSPRSGQLPHTELAGKY
jgi:hypothetical protein